MEQILLKNLKLEGNDELQAILLKDQLIEWIRPMSCPLPEGCKEYDFGGKLAVPGLINVHTHLDKSRLSKRVINETGSIGEARTKLLEYKRSMCKEDIKERARQTVMESIRNGVIAIRTHVDVDPVIRLRGIEALLELRDELKDIITLQVVAFPQEGITEAEGTYDLMCQAMEMGTDVVGGHLSIAKDFVEHSARVFDIAEKYGKEIDIHVDYDINRDYSVISRHKDGLEYPDALGIMAMCEDKIDRAFPYRVNASHLCGLDSAAPEHADNIIALIKKAGVNVVTLPPNNMYCNGRGDLSNTRRGVTKVKALLAAGVEVLFGPDNIMDPFNPLGTPNMVQNAVLTAYACHMASAKDYRKLFDMCTYGAAKAMSLENYGLESGKRASITILDAESMEDALAKCAPVSALFRDGRLMFQTSSSIEQHF